MKSGDGPRAGNAIVSTDWAAFYEETHVPAALRVADTLHVTGHTGDSTDGSYPADPEAQIRQTFSNIAVTLAEAGATWRDVVSMTTYHVGLSSQRELLLTVAHDFLEPPFPAWSAVGVSELWSPEAICEISCIAVLKWVNETP
jgi:enamine deaminase RidA (YjgF/YER057c/UK114 family)